MMRVSAFAPCFCGDRWRKVLATLELAMFELAVLELAVFELAVLGLPLAPMGIPAPRPITLKNWATCRLHDHPISITATAASPQVDTKAKKDSKRFQ